MRITTLFGLFFLLQLFFFPALLKAQEPCGTDEIHQKLMDTDPDYKNRRLLNERKLQEYIKTHSAINRSGRAVNDTIPVVVHVLHTGQAVGTTYNISDAQIQSSIDRANEAFANYDGSGTDTNIRFALAERDPYGCTSGNGINRIDATGVQDYENIGMSSDATRLDLFNLSRWNTEEYLNLWVVSEINDNNGGTGTQGFATFSNTSHRYDGVVCMYNTVGYDPTSSLGYELKSTGNQNETVIHEFGHYLDLYHTFQGDNDRTTCPTDADCGTNGDCCSDTDPHQRTYSNVCWTGTTNSCTGNNYGEVVQNYMAYSSQDCKDRFSADQVARMQAILLTGRAGLLTSPGLKEVTMSEPTAACTATTSSTGTSDEYGVGIIKITIGTWTTESGTAYEDGGYMDNWCNHIDLAPNTTYSYEITTSGNYDEYVQVWIDYDNDGTFTNASELIISTIFGSSFSGTFTTPSTVIYNTALRIRFRGSAVTNSTDACYDPTYSQAEDYAVYFDSPAELTASASNLTNLRALTTSTLADQTFTLSGDNLFGDALLDLEGTDFEISNDGSTYHNSLTLTESGGNLQSEPVTIYTRLKSGLSIGSYIDSIAISSTDADTVWVNLEGEVDEVDNIRGNALDLDGSGDAATTTLALPATYTKEAWVYKPSSATATTYNILSSVSSGSHAFYAPNSQSNQLSAGHNGSWTLVQDTEALPTDEWVHVALTYDASGQQMNLYKNGFLVDNATSVANHGGSEIAIGSHNGGSYWEGLIDEVRIWSVVRTEAEIRANMHLTLNGTETGLEAYLQFNESSGTLAGEPIKGYDATLSGDATFSSSTLDVGAGTCSTITLASTGDASVEVSSNDIAIDFTDGGTAPGGDLLVFLLEGDPANNSGANYEASQHWVIRNFGTNQSGLNIASIEITLPMSDPILAYHESTMSLYKRESGSDGSWNTVASSAAAIDYGTGVIAFNSLSGFTSFSQVSSGSSGAALPVSWLHFSAVRSGIGDVHLEWSTGTEANCKGFQVERSYDGHRFESIGFVPCQGTSSGTAFYHYPVEEDKAAYFRLRQEDQDRAYDYSQIRYVASQMTAPVFSVFPNPSNGLVSLHSEQVNADDRLSLELMSTNGQQLLRLQGTLSELSSQLNEKLATLPKGVFLLQLHAGEASYTERLLIY